MTKVPGPSLRELDRRGDAFAELVAIHLGRVAGRAARNLGGVVTAQGSARQASVSLNDIDVIPAFWNGIVDRELMTPLVEQWVDAAQEQVNRTIEALSEDALAAITLPVFNPQSAGELFLSQAQNRLRGIGDALWEDARASLVEGMQNGESIPALAARVREAAGVATPRATTIARTEVLGATNAGSYEAMLATGMITVKEWLATRDSRTRETHVAADGQRVFMADKFSIGGSPADRPHDVILPADERINCRCTLLYDVAAEEGECVCANSGSTSLLAAAGEDCRCIESETPTTAIANTEPGLTAEQRAALTAERNWTKEKREAMLAALRETEMGRVLADTLDRFQDGGSISRLRKVIDQYLAGEALNATSMARARAFLGALRSADPSIVPDPLYRGMSVKGTLENVLKKYTVGETLDFNITSFTSDRAIARNFQKMTAGKGTTRIMVEMRGGGQAIPIQNLARDPRLFKEKEWVTGGRFVIDEVKKSPDGGIILRVRQVSTP